MKFATPRTYKNLVPDYAEMIPVDEWDGGVSMNIYSVDNGSGFWVRNGRQSHDDVFTTEAKDATHVAWYSKNSQ